MTRQIILLLIILLMLAGCGGETNPVQEEAPPPTTNPTAPLPQGSPPPLDPEAAATATVLYAPEEEATATGESEEEATTDEGTGEEVAGAGECEIETEVTFDALLSSQSELADQLGCPIGPAQESWAAWQPYEAGNMMIWLESNDRIFVLQDGRWQSFEDTWQEGEPEIPPGVPTPQSGQLQPIRGFGRVWAPISDTLGYPLAEEQGYDAVVQPFANGWLVTTPLPSILFLQDLITPLQESGSYQLWLQQDGEWLQQTEE